MIPYIVSDLSPKEKIVHEPIYLSLVLPTYNERNNIEQVIKQTYRVLDGVLPGRYELIIVDDDSPDYTWAVAESLKPDYPHLTVIRRAGERGLGTAVIRGWQAAQGEILGIMDADLPNVCIGLKIKCMTPYEMLRHERAHFVLGPQAS